MPLSSVPFAFLDPKHNDQELCVHLTQNFEEVNRWNMSEMLVFDFNNLGNR